MSVVIYWEQGRPPQADELENAALYIAVPFLFLNKDRPMIELSGLHYILEELKSATDNRAKQSDV